MIKEGVVDQSDNKLYVVTPTVMMDYLEQVRKSALKYPDMVVLVPSNDLNPETDKYYGEDETFVKSRGQKPSDRPQIECKPISYDEMLHKIDSHQVKTPQA